MSTTKQYGATLLELLIGVVILAILAGLSAPAFSNFLGSSRLRATAESVLAGLQLARAEAIRRNTTVCFYIDTSSSASSLWFVNLDDTTTGRDCNSNEKPGISDASGGYFIQKSAAKEGASVTFALTPATSNTITFNSFGKVLATNTSSGSCPLNKIIFSSSNTSQRYQINIKTPDCASSSTTPSGGQVRLCDPSSSIPVNDPRYCAS